MFFPTSDIMQGYMVAVWVTVGMCLYSGGRGNVAVAVALAVSWIAARSATATGSQEIMAILLPICAAIAITGLTVGSLAIAFLYAFRIFLFSLGFFGTFHAGLLWELNLVPLTLQLIIALGTAIGGLAAHSTSSNFVADMFRKYDKIANRAIFN